jgi:transposase
VIGMDPHKRSATIEAIDEREKILTRGRFGTDTAGYQLMLTAGPRLPRPGLGHRTLLRHRPAHIAQRLVADGETVLDVPPKLSARVRVFDTGRGRKTDPVNAHSVAVAGLYSRGLRPVSVDDVTVVVRLLVDRRDELGRARTDIISRIHHLLLELLPGGAKKFLTRGQASSLLRTAPAPDNIVAQTRHDLARELIEELTTIDAKIRAADKQLRQLVTEHGSTLTELYGIGPSGAARLIGDIGGIHRFRTAAHFASWNGTAPLEASSGDQRRHRLSRAGNRRINRVLHIMAVVQLRRDTPGPRLLPATPGRGQDHDGSAARAQTPPVRRRLQADAPRRESAPSWRNGSGRTLGSDSAIQRGRPDPDSRLFGQVTTRTRHGKPRTKSP